MKHTSLLVLALSSAIALMGCQSETTTSDPTTMSKETTPATPKAEQPKPPTVAKRDHTVSAPAGDRNDPYYWLRDDTRKNEEMLAYLNAENAYTDAMMKPHAALKDTLYKEIVARIKQDDSSVPYKWKDYWYYSSYSEGQDYPVYARRKGSMEGAEEILLDVNAMAKGHDFFQVGTYTISPNQKLLAWVEDNVGRREYTIRVKNLETGEVYADEIKGISGSIEWANDNQTLLYIEKDPTTLLTKRVKSHKLGTPVSNDVLIYEEPDDSFYMGLSRTRSDDFLCIYLSSTVSTEMRCAPADNPKDFKVFAERKRDFEYSADHLNGRWVISTDWDAPNFRLMQVADNKAFQGREAWQELEPHNENVFIQSYELFNDFYVVDERSEGLRRLRVVPNKGESFFVNADESAYAMGLSTNAEADSNKLRYSYRSLTTPTTIYEVDVTNGKRDMLKQDPVLGDFNAANYKTERLWVTARDGVKVPVSVVYHKDTKIDGTAPMLQYAYGSYGSSTDPRFSSVRLSLLDRGFVYAIAHIRGGQEMGRKWYEDGKMLNKKNTFNDFIDVSKDLVKRGYAHKDRVGAFGGSAGGLLMGAIVNQSPETYRAVLASVPFVDVVTTMLDESIPLTTNEFDEWGNPKEPKYYEYMLSYSPYDNVRKQDYPAMYVDTGLWDSQVQYFEPAKWVAKLREHKTDTHPLLFRINMSAGHGGKSGRFEKYKEVAEEYAFLMSELGVK